VRGLEGGKVRANRGRSIEITRPSLEVKKPARREILSRLAIGEARTKIEGQRKNVQGPMAHDENIWSFGVGSTEPAICS